MYRAYHAPIRTAEGGLLRNAQGRPTNAVYIFVTMLRKLLNEHKPEYIAASFDLPGRTFRDDLAADYKANRTPMPDELAEQIPLVHAACEALGVPILTYERYEADDVIGTLATRRRPPASTSRSSPATRTSSSWSRDGIRVFNPRDEGTWYDADGVKEKFGVAPEQVVDVLALMGDTIDNIKGVPGIGEKGARELISTYGSLDEPARARRRGSAEAVPRGAARQRRRRRGRAASWCGSAPTCRSSSTPTALRYRGASRERCFEIFTELGFRTLVAEYAPTAEHHRRRPTGSSTPPRSVRGARRAAAGSRALRAARPARPAPSAMTRRHRRASRSRPRRGDADYVPDRGHRGACGDTSASLPARRRRSTRCKPLLEDAAIEQGRPRSEVRRHRARAPRRRRCAGCGIDTMLASYLLDATRRTHPLEDLALEHISYKALTEEDVCGRGVKACRSATCRSKRRSTMPASAPTSPASSRRLLPRAARTRAAATRSTTTLERPLIPVLAAVERAGVRIDGPALAAQSQHVEQELRQRTQRDLRAGRRASSTSTRRSSSPRSCSTSCSCRRSKRTGTSRRAVDGGRGARGARARARPAAADSRVARR